MIKRMFEAFLRKPSRYFFSMDSDTEIHRRFKFLPDKDFFGSWSCKEYNSLQGGFIGYSLDAVRKIIDSKIFLNQMNCLITKKHGQLTNI